MPSIDFSWFRDGLLGRLRANRSSLKEAIRWVAEAVGDRSTFKERARTVASQLGRRSVRRLSREYYADADPPEDLKASFPGYGDWMQARQLAIFEILYNLRTASLPTLRRAAFGSDEWIQGWAINILCRLAADGVETDALVMELANGIPGWRYETLLRSMCELARLAATSPTIAAALRSLVQEWSADDPIDGLEILEPLSVNAPEVARGDIRLLYDVFRRHGRGIRSAVADGQVVQDPSTPSQFIVADGPTYPSLLDYHAIRAALILHRLDPTNSEVIDALGHWAQHHPDERIRVELQGMLARPRNSEGGLTSG